MREADRNTMTLLGDAALEALGNAYEVLNVGNAPGLHQTALGFAAADLRKRLALEGMSAEGIRSVLNKAAPAIDKLYFACESPIEREMCAPLVMASYEGFLSVPPQVHTPKSGEMHPDADLVIIPQYPAFKYRLDFAVIGRDGDRQKIVALECDGQAYHQDGRRDFDRDQYLASTGITVIRATGAEIKADPIAVARRVASLLIMWKLGG